MTAALSGSCFAQDIMQGDSYVCMYTHIARKREKCGSNQSHKS